MELEAFLHGGSFDAGDHFGAHRHPDGGWVFRVYAPHAKQVTLEGDFSRWHEVAPVSVHKGVYEFRYLDAREGQCYKYCVYSKRGVREERADPYASGSECPPRNASVLRDLTGFAWHDGDWMAGRTTNTDRPLTIYELHSASWKKRGGRWLSWRQLAEELVPWLRRFHFTHVELMPVAEYPMDGSWGYQCTGFFCPTARHGTPGDFAAFVDTLHREGFGVIVDFVCVHFASDRFALQLFDGAALYESRRAANRRSDWGSRYFDHGSGVVRSFLQSAAERWLSVYHVDGLRMDAVSHLLYSNGRPEDGENTDGLLFLQGLNRGLKERHPTAMLIAEDATAYPGTTAPLDTWGGLGFDYKWDMGWTYNVTGFLQAPPSERGGMSGRLTMGIGHARDARWMLVFSHDDASWRNLAERMPGVPDARLRQARLFLLLMIGHPGKKLLFMGTELAMGGSWSLRNNLNWRIDDDSAYLGYTFFVEDLLRLAAENDALFAADHEPWGAAWVCCNDGGNCIYGLLRHGHAHHVLAVMNFAAVQQSHDFALPNAASLSLLLHTDWIEYEGHTPLKSRPFRLENGRIFFTLPRYSGMLLEVGY